MKLLVVEDHRALVASLFAYFEPRGHALDAAPDGASGLRLVAAHDYDAVILDWMMPRLDGEAFLRELRETLRKDVPVLMLTARERTEDKVHALRVGADDYLAKPFELIELEARLEALVRRARRQVAAVRLQVADLSLDLSTSQVQRAGEPIELHTASRQLLEELMRASPAVVPRERLERVIWGDSSPDHDLLRSHIHLLRRAIDGPFSHKLLQTVPRIGYRLSAGTERVDDVR